MTPSPMYSWQLWQTPRTAQSDVGLVIAGEPRLEAQIKTYLARMANRVDFYASLRGLSPSEVESYLADFEITEDAMVELKHRPGREPAFPRTSYKGPGGG